MKVIKINEVGPLIKDKDTVAISGSGGSGSPEGLLEGLVNYYNEYHKPQNITVTCGISPGNLTKDEVGMNRLAKKGLVGKAICAHVGMGRVFGEMIGQNLFPAFVLPLGVINHLYRAIGALEDGIITHIGLDTFADPKLDGCCANSLAKKEEPIVKRIKIDGKDNLFYKTFPINVALLKGTYADTDGNISLEEEGVIGEQYNMAIAAHNSGGIVIVEVKEIKEKNTLHPRNVLIHSSFVDYVVVNKPDENLGEYNIPKYRPELCGDKKITLEDIKIRTLDARKVCARRASLEIKKGDVINLGVGMPDSVANVAFEEGVYSDIELSIETGVTGGVPIGGVVFGSSINPTSIIPMASQFDAYNGGSLDMAIIGFAEVDKLGNVNVSNFGTRITGPGGFTNIVARTKVLIFMGTFTATNLEEEIKDEKLIIKKDGEIKKFVKKLRQITFASKNALENNQKVLYVTERCVFELTSKGIILKEIAPGIDLEKDILNQMAFKPLISSNLKTMDKRIFRNEKMNLLLK